MYLWKVDSLVEDLRTGVVTQKEEFKYILLFTVAMAIASDPVMFIDFSYNYYDTISSIANISITIIGIFYCYKINAIGDNKDFILRLICIGLPVLIRTLVIFIPIFIIAGALEGVVLATSDSEMSPLETTLTQTLMVVLMASFYYYYLSTKIRAVSSENA